MRLTLKKSGVALTSLRKEDKSGNNLKFILASTAFADYLPTKFTVLIHGYTIRYAVNLWVAVF